MVMAHGRLTTRTLWTDGLGDSMSSFESSLSEAQFERLATQAIFAELIHVQAHRLLFMRPTAH